MGKLKIIFIGILWSSLASATTYYVDSVSGSDVNSGHKPGVALKTIAKVNSLALAPGDDVLFKRGQTFTGTLSLKYSGIPSLHITYGAYGSGALPLISGAGKAAYGMSGVDRGGITVENLAFTAVTESAILLQRSTDWKIANVHIYHTGGPSLFGAIHCSAKATATNPFPGCKRIWIDHVTIQDTSGEGIYFAAAERITITNSVIQLSHGSTADNIQVSYSRDVQINGNDLSQVGSSTGKGNICLCFTSKAVYYPTNEVRDNHLNGGNFGLSVFGEGVVVDGNDIEGHRTNDYSSDIISSDGTSSLNITITNNLLKNSNYGLTIGGEAASDIRHTYNISGNMFYLPKLKGIHIYATTVTGQANKNTVYSTSKVTLFDSSSALTHAGNTSVTAAPKYTPVDVSDAGAH